MRPSIHIVVLVLLLGTASAAPEDCYRTVPGTGVRLVPPEGFEAAADFSGFLHQGTQSSIVVKVVPGSLAEIDRGFTAEKLLSRGMTLVSRSPTSVTGREAFLLHLEQKADGVLYSKWLLLMQGETPNQTVMVNAACPKKHGFERFAILKRAVLSTRAARTGQVLPGTSVPFVIEPAEPLKLAKVVRTVLFYTETGKHPPEDPAAARFAVLSSHSTVETGVDAREKHSLRRIRQVTQVREVRVVSSQTVTIDCLQGIEVVAEAKLVKTGTTVRLYQVILYEEGTYYLMQGRVGADAGEEIFEAFRKTARTFARK